MIDEQIDMWQNLNELDKQKEQALAEANARLKAARVDGGSNAGSAHHDDDEDDDYGDDGAEMFDWRTRRL